MVLASLAYQLSIKAMCVCHCVHWLQALSLETDLLSSKPNSKVISATIVHKLMSLCLRFFIDRLEIKVAPTLYYDCFPETVSNL